MIVILTEKEYELEKEYIIDSNRELVMVQIDDSLHNFMVVQNKYNGKLGIFKLVEIKQFITQYNLNKNKGN